MPPMLADDLKSTIGPAMTLFLESIERIGQQAMAIAPIGIMHLPALLKDRKAEIGVFNDRCAGPCRCRRSPHIRRSLPGASPCARHRDDPVVPGSWRPWDRQRPG